MDAPEGRPTRPLASVVEIVALTALVLSYLWLWQGAFRGHALVLAVMVIPLLVWSHRRNGEGFARIGFRLDNLGRSAMSVGLVLGSLVLLVLLAGAVTGGLAFPPLECWPASLGWLILGGILQQYVLAGFYYRRFSDLLPDTWTSYLAAAAIFALAHLPNPFLLVLTPVVGFLSCWLYRRAPNLWILGLAHGVLSFCLYYGLPRSLTFGLRVGPSFFQP